MTYQDLPLMIPLLASGYVLTIYLMLIVVKLTVTRFSRFRS